MPSCYICGAYIPRGGGFRRQVYTGSSTRMYMFGRRPGTSFGSYFGIRTVCHNCAIQIENSNEKSGRILLSILLIGFVIFLFMMGLNVLALILITFSIIGYLAFSSKTRKLKDDQEHSRIQDTGDQHLKIEGSIPKQSQSSSFVKPTFNELSKQEEQISDEQEEIEYTFPSIDLLNVYRDIDTVTDDSLIKVSEILQNKFAMLGIQIETISVSPGPIFTTFEILIPTNVRFSKIEALKNDIALALASKDVQIERIPGRNTIAIIALNLHPALVTIRSLLNSKKFKEARGALPITLGKTITGEIFIDDLSRMPHVLIAGTTGSGKSMGIHSILTSLLYRLHPSEVKFVIIDPKKIEFSLYNHLRRHYLAVSPDLDEDIITSPSNAILVLKSVELEMEKRQNIFAITGARSIADYNERIINGQLANKQNIKHHKLPYIIIVIDELAELMITAAKEIEEPITRLAQLAQAVGIHLIVATQRPSVDVITGSIKANFPTRIAFKVASRIDSQTILDMNGAELLLGNGDMLFLSPKNIKPIRLHNAFISVNEIERIMSHIARQPGYSKPMQLPSILDNMKSSRLSGRVEHDELFEEAARVIVRHQQGSISLLQRRLKIGYSQAARLVDELEKAGIVSPFDGSKSREVLVDSEEQLESILKRFR